MMKYEVLEKINDAQFRRSTGVKRVTFNKMHDILIGAYQSKKAQGGRPSKLTVVEMLYCSYLKVGLMQHKLFYNTGYE